MTSPPTTTASAGARAREVWARLERQDRLALIGAAVTLVGALTVVVSDGVGANGDSGIAWIVALAAVAILSLVGAAILRPRVREVDAALVPGLALGLLLITVLDLLQPVRYSADLDVFGGVLGLVGRVLAVVGSAVTVVGTPPGRLGLASSAGRLAIGGLVAILVAWLIVLVLPEGFAMRSIDAVGLLAAAVSAATPWTPFNPGASISFAIWRSLLRPVAATAAALIVLEGVLSVVGELGELVAGAVGVIGLIVYLVGGVLLAAAAILDARPLMASVRPVAPTTPSAPTSSAA